MPKFAASDSDCFVYTYREGALSVVGHDLKLRVGDFTIDGTEEPPAIRAEVRADSLRVVGAVKDGGVSEGELSLQEKREIEAHINKDVLETGKYPTISFRSTSIEKEGDSRYQVAGQLYLHGVKREIGFMVQLQSGRAVARGWIHQPDFGIKPFRAFLGMLRVKPDVLVEVTVPYKAD